MAVAGAIQMDALVPRRADKSTWCSRCKWGTHGRCSIELRLGHGMKAICKCPCKKDAFEVGQVKLKHEKKRRMGDAV